MGKLPCKIRAARVLSLICCLLITGILHSQSNISLKYFGLTIHPFGDQMAHVQPYRFDDNAYFVGNIGGFLKYEKFVWEDFLAIDVAQAVFSDCSAGMASVTSVGAHVLLLEKNKHRFYLDLGTTLFVREDWNRFEDYVDDGDYKRTSFGNKNWQYGFYPVSLMFEYDYRLSEKWDLTVDILPYPVIGIGAGVKYWFSKDFRFSDKLIIPE